MLHSEILTEILTKYKDVYSKDDSKEEWFNRIKELCTNCGFTPNVKEYKQNPDAFKGHVGSVSNVIRVAVTGRTKSPDLYSIMKTLGKDRVIGVLMPCGEQFDIDMSYMLVNHLGIRHYVVNIKEAVDAAFDAYSKEYKTTIEFIFIFNPLCFETYPTENAF